MPDPIDPAQQATAPVQQSAVPANPPAGFIEQARYTGVVQAVEKLTLDGRSKDTQIAQLTSEIERLKGEAVVKDTEKTIAVGERDKQLQTLVEHNKSTDAEIADLRALKLKMEVAKELGKPELIKIADRIPNLTDREVLKTVMSDIAGFADEAVREREKQLMAGITPTIPSIATTAVAPGSEKDWDSHINSLPLGSKERTQAYDRYYEWITTKK
jgi:hypothetical protein